jgi:hypothetical protein
LLLLITISRPENQISAISRDLHARISSVIPAYSFNPIKLDRLVKGLPALTQKQAADR